MSSARSKLLGARAVFLASRRVDSWLSVGSQLALSWLYSWLSVGSAVFSRFRDLHKNYQIYIIIKGGGVVPNSMILCKKPRAN